MIRLRLLFALALSTFLMLGSSSLAQDTADWTLLIYMEADNNLEGDAIADLLEMEMIGSSDDVNVVVHIDRAVRYTQADGNWTDARRYYIERNPDAGTIEDIVIQKKVAPEDFSLYSPVIEELGETNNGDPQTLVDFILWGAETYPAEKYGLIMWNHGGTWVAGFGGDESTPNKDVLTMAEIDTALDLVTESLGQKFEFIGFDACLMGQMETFSLLSRYAHYASGAEELEPAYGWYYTPVLEQLTSNPGMNGAELGQSVLENYMYFYDEIMPAIAGRPFWMEYDQSVVDLQYMEQVESSISQFVEVAQANAEEILPAVIDARNNTQFFGASTPDAADPLSSVDLMHFMELLISLSENEAVDAAAQSVVDAVDALVVANAASEGLPGTNGMSIFYPRNARAATTYNTAARYQSELDYMHDWNDFLELFYTTAEESAGTVGMQILEVFQLEDGPVSVSNPPTIIFASDGANLSDLTFMAVQQFDDGFQYILDRAQLESVAYTPDGESYVDVPDGYYENYYTWPTEMTVITDGETTVPTLLMTTNNDERFAVSGLYGDQEGNTLDAYLIFELETRSVVNVWGVNPSQNGGQPFEIEPQPGDEFLPTLRFIDASGDDQLTPAFESLTFSDEPFTYWFEPADSGTYRIRLSVEDAAGEYYYDEVEVTVDNDNADANYRPVFDLNYGIAFPVPWDWGDPIDYELEDGGLQIDAFNPDDTINVYVNFYDGTSAEDALSALDDYVDGTDIILSAEPSPLMIDGYEGYRVPYALSLDELDFTGELLAVTVPDNETVYLIDFEVMDIAADEVGDYLDVLIERTRFFEPPLDE